MKQEFSTSWLSSVQPRKQRKFTYNAPLHARRRFLSAHLSDALQDKHNIRSLPVRKGDEVSIMRGSMKKKTGKITSVNMKTSKVYIENMVTTKKDGTKVLVPFHPSNLQIISLADDGKRFSAASKKEAVKSIQKEEKKTEKKEETKSTKNVKTQNKEKK